MHPNSGRVSRFMRHSDIQITACCRRIGSGNACWPCLRWWKQAENAPHLRRHLAHRVSVISFHTPLCRSLRFLPMSCLAYVRTSPEAVIQGSSETFELVASMLLSRGCQGSSNSEKEGVHCRWTAIRGLRESWSRVELLRRIKNWTAFISKTRRIALGSRMHDWGLVSRWQQGSVLTLMGVRVWEYLLSPAQTSVVTGIARYIFILDSVVSFVFLVTEGKISVPYLNSYLMGSFCRGTQKTQSLCTISEVLFSWFLLSEWQGWEGLILCIGFGRHQFSSIACPAWWQRRPCYQARVWRGRNTS